jgi:hypothetical protein
LDYPIQQSLTFVLRAISIIDGDGCTLNDGHSLVLHSVGSEKKSGFKEKETEAPLSRGMQPTGSEQSEGNALTIRDGIVTSQKV